MMKLISNSITILFCFIAVINFDLKAQNVKRFKNAIELTSDNDAYGVSENNDRYYSFGTVLKIYFEAPKLLGLEKLFSKKEYCFFSAGISSEGYTPTRMDYSEIPEEDLYFDRPFAGLLFGTFDANYILENFFFKTELYLGVLGPFSKASEIQNWIHKNITIDDFIKGWEYQIPNQLLVNLNFRGVYDIKSIPSWLDLYVEGEARLGNLYIDATPTLGLRMGKFNKLTKSLSNGLFNEKSNTELYFKSTFSYSFVAFDATAQGRLFNNNYKYAVDDLSHFYPSTTLGVFLTYKQFVMEYENVFNFGKVIKGSYHNFGRFKFSYLF